MTRFNELTTAQTRIADALIDAILSGHRRVRCDPGSGDDFEPDDRQARESVEGVGQGTGRMTPARPSLTTTAALVAALIAAERKSK